MSESTPRRSHDGCWTCKARRRKCDRARPTCQACDQRGLACEGYEVRLRWGSGIASRGRFTGAPEPVITSIPPRPKGRRRDRSRERQQRWSTDQVITRHDDTEVSPDSDPAPLLILPQVSKGMSGDEKLFHDFCSTGINMLHSTTVHDAGSLLRPQLPILCHQSESLYRICLALQVSITPSVKDRFFEYFDAALNQFRAELARSLTWLEDGTFTAGLLLCSIGLVHGTPWTMHLQGMYNILQTHGISHCRAQSTPFRTHLLEVMGVMDLPTFTVGRKNPCLGVWKQYCRDRLANDTNFDGGGIEVVSGIPRSLLDLFSCVGAGVTEQDFWDWPGAQGSLLQYPLWEAYRLAGILTVRHGQLLSPAGAGTGIVQSPDSKSREPLRNRPLPPTEVIVPRILSNIDAICRASVEQEGKGSLVLNAIQYPIFVAGLQAHIINANPELKQVIHTSSENRKGRQTGRDEQLVYELLQEWWECYQNTPSIQHLAEARGIELGLF